VETREAHATIVDLNLEALLAPALSAARVRALRAKRPALAIRVAADDDALFGAKVEPA
jgi:hypothetical protein